MCLWQSTASTPLEEDTLWNQRLFSASLQAKPFAYCYMEKTVSGQDYATTIHISWREYLMCMEGCDFQWNVHFPTYFSTYEVVKVCKRVVEPSSQSHSELQNRTQVLFSETAKTHASV